MSETSEHYELEIMNGAVQLWDNRMQTVVETFIGPDRLLNATAELNRLQAADAPAAYLTKVKERSRLRHEAHLEKLRGREATALAEMNRASRALNEAIEERVSYERDMGLSPLSATETAENGSGVAEGTLAANEAPGEAQSVPVTSVRLPVYRTETEKGLMRFRRLTPEESQAREASITWNDVVAMYHKLKPGSH